MLFLQKVVAIAAVLALAASAADAKPANRARALPQKSAAAIIQPTPRPDIDRDWTPDIRAAHAMLAPLSPGYASIKQYRWYLAVKCGNAPTKAVKMGLDGSNADGYIITKNIDNGINTRFTVKKPAGCVVLAQKRVIRTPSGLTEAVYTAYAPELDTPVMLAHGRKYLESLTAHAYEELESREIWSGAYVAHEDGEKSFPAKTVAEAIPRDVALGLQITEHIDPARVKFVGLRQCIHEVLVTFAANREYAYDYAVSSVGARGISQFMERSYDMIRSRYPGAGLNPDFVNGMDDHRNATIASVLHFDLELTELSDKFLHFFAIDKNGPNLGTFLAAGYNWNAKKVAKVYAKTGRLSKGLPKETRSYVTIALQVFKYVSVQT